MSCTNKMGFATRQIHTARPHIQGINPLATPIFQTSTFVFDSASQGAARFAGEEEGYIYTRLGNPNGKEVAEKVACLEGAEAGLTMGSGMGAVSATIWTLLQAGDHLIADRALYGCTFALFCHGLPRYGIEISLIDTNDLEALRAALRPNTRVVYFETISNPDIKLADIGGISTVVHEYNPAIQVVVDSTFASPYLVRPLEYGADIVLHSATKYINGHGDVIAGIVAGKKDMMDQINIYGIKDATGSVLGPFEAFLINRGLKTLDIRMRRHSENAMKVAAFLEGHPAVKTVLYPGLASHPQHELALRMMPRGFSGMITFELKSSRERAAQFINDLKLCTLAVSLGDAETLIEHPASMTHSTYDAEALAAAGIRESMIRLSIGLEDPEDIIADLKEGLDKI